MKRQAGTVVFLLSAMLVLSGSVLYLIRWMHAPWLFAAGTAGIMLCYMALPHKTPVLRLRRLYRLNLLAGMAMIAASVFMFKHQKEWIACLLASALIQLYTSFVIPPAKKE
jgi:hypothetical protein